MPVKDKDSMRIEGNLAPGLSTCIGCTAPIVFNLVAKAAQMRYQVLKKELLMQSILTEDEIDRPGVKDILLKEIKPNVKKILVITDTTPTGKGVCAILNSHMQKNPEFPLEIETRIAKTFADYKKYVREANMRDDLHAIFPNVSGLNKNHGGRAVLPEIITWTVKNSKKPEIGMTYFLVEFGFLCGVTVDFPALGGQTAVKAARILSGEDPGHIPIEDAIRFAIALNLARADQLNMKIPFRILGAADRVYKTMKLYPSYRIGK